MNNYKLFPTDRILIGLLAVIFTAVLALFIGLSLFNYPSADDFCYAAKARDLGFFGAQVFWYEQWSGRYTLNLIWTAFMLSGDVFHTYRFPPIILLITTWLSASFLIAKIAQGHISIFLTLLFGGVVTLLFIAGVPDPAQTFYWLGGSFTYQMPNVFLILLLGLLIWRETTASNKKLQRLIFIIASLLVIAIIGANEISLLLTSMIILGGALYALLMRRDSRMFWMALLLIAAGAALISILAPGNAQRMVAEHGRQLRPTPWLAALLYLPWVGLRIFYWLSNLGLWASALIVFLLTLPAASRFLYANGKFRRLLLLFPVLWIAAIFILSGIGFLINYYPLPERAESVIYLLFLLGWYPSFMILAHWMMGNKIAGNNYLIRPALVFLIISLLGTPNTFEAYKDVYRGYRYDQEMRERINAIYAAKQRGEMEITVNSLSRPPRTLFATDLATDFRNPRNQCLSEYLKIRSITLGPPK